MLANMMLKRVVDFHGHLCPDLILGGKVCELVASKFADEIAGGGRISVIAENTTSTLDAIQILLGATMGNQRLQIMDFGKHNYTVVDHQDRKCRRLSLKPRQIDDETAFRAMEARIMSDQATRKDVIRFQKILDRRVMQLASVSPATLFQVETIEPTPHPTEFTSVYFECTLCGQPVLKSRKIDFKENCYCIPCFQQLNVCRSGGRLQ